MRRFETLAGNGLKMQRAIGRVSYPAKPRIDF
jgi:hypothetical protein